jgi:hypothetical protein
MLQENRERPFFMITQPASVVATGHSDVLAALQVASRKTGLDFDYLLNTAMRESSLNSQAKSKSSSASGLFQFIDQTWLGLIKQFGERYGLGAYAGAIQQTADGKYTVASADTRAAILALRQDPQVSACMAGENAKQTKQSLECALGREVCGGELYAAHFLGPSGARRLIQRARRCGVPASRQSESRDVLSRRRHVEERRRIVRRNRQSVFSSAADTHAVAAEAERTRVGHYRLKFRCEGHGRDHVRLH